VLTAAALQTSRIRLGTMVASPNFRHPVHFAREITALDDICAGRLSVGIGAGGFGYDAAVLNQPELSLRDRTERFAEFVTLLDLLLRQDGVTWSGNHYGAVDARSNPGCAQSPRVPFVVAGNGPRALALAARFGQGWVTTGAGPADSLDAWWRSAGELCRRFADTGSTADRFLSLDAAPVYSLSSAEHFVDAVDRAARLGFTDVLTHWPRAQGWYAGSESVLEEVAAALPALRTPATPDRSAS
jgi:alkanesulfonate monooxygenase SsuD/methylene tetrahydromethanopterin reductase-like flavin-dependent oxidoreductase (luciferase family)